MRGESSNLSLVCCELGQTTVENKVKERSVKSSRDNDLVLKLEGGRIKYVLPQPVSS